MSRRYGLIRPCPHCPFRNDIDPYLRPERTTEIATHVWTVRTNDLDAYRK